MTGNETHAGPLQEPGRVSGEAGEGYEKGTGFAKTDTTPGENGYVTYVPREELARTGKQATGRLTGLLRQRGVL
jgi:hypothetical protein